MILGNIKRFEVMVVVLDVWTACNLESHAPENIDDLIDHQRQWMSAAAPPPRARESDVDTLSLKGLRLGLIFDIMKPLFQAFFHETAQLVKRFAGARTLLGRQVFKPA